jgi:anti-sigma factor RsiW
MCDFTEKLMTWVDKELSDYDAAAVERHLQGCPECRDRVETYRRVSSAFDRYCDAYCDAVTASKPGRKLTRRVLAISGGVAVAAAVAMFFLLAARWRVQPAAPSAAPIPTVIDVAKTLPPAHVAQPAPAVIRPVARIERRKRAEQAKQAAAQGPSKETSWLASEPAVEIAIPADAFFPPGAVPEGVGFTADVTIAPDGSAQQVRLHPQLTEFERRPTRP